MVIDKASHLPVLDELTHEHLLLCFDVELLHSTVDDLVGADTSPLGSITRHTIVMLMLKGLVAIRAEVTHLILALDLAFVRDDWSHLLHRWPLDSFLLHLRDHFE